METIIESFQQRTPVADIKGEVAGLAIPFNISDDRPGLWWDEAEDGLTFFEYTTFAPETFDWQLALPEWGGRVRFLWSHGMEMGMTTLPIGDVIGLTATREALMFRAQLGETHVADELRKVVAAGSVKEVSVSLRVLERTFETDAEKDTYRRVTKAELFDVSLVVHAQFPQTRLLEVRCDGCGSVPQDDHKTPDTDGSKTGHRIYPSGEPAVIISKAALGSLYAHINEQTERERLRYAKEVAKC